MSLILVQVIVGGLLLGAVYALFSSGLTLVWGMMNIVNFAHGDFVMLGMYVAYVVFTVFGAGPWAGAPIAALLLATLGIVVVTVVLPYLPFAAILGFTPLPLKYLAIAAVIVMLYIVSGEVAKHVFYRRFDSPEPAKG